MDDTGMDHLSPQEHLELAATQLVNEFIIYGEVVQMNDQDEYGPGSAIYELACALNRVKPGSVDVVDIWTREESI